VFAADAYAIDTKTRVRLELKKNTGRERWPLSKRLASFIPDFGVREEPPPPEEPPPDIESSRSTSRRAAPGTRRPHFSFAARRRRTVTRARYVGAEDYKRTLLAQDFSLPPGMEFETVDTGPALPLPPGATHVVPVRIRVPDNAVTGTEYSINVRAEDAEGRLVGGVTFLLHVQN
jgi:hypothetical protein